jgi:hypothetical protein
MSRAKFYHLSDQSFVWPIQAGQKLDLKNIDFNFTNATEAI